MRNALASELQRTGLLSTVMRQLPVLWRTGPQHFVLALVLILAQPAQGDERTVRLATTTSTENSGLLQVLLPPFEKQRGYRIHVIAAGTGKALRMARDGDVDVVLVHAYTEEKKFIALGHGVNRRDVMHNDFIIVGPGTDPAGIRGSKDAVAALQNIATSSATFISRGDDSGTHKRELALWQAAGLRPAGKWYHQVGQGMGKTLQMAKELSAYTLTDRGTWLAQHRKITNLDIVVEGDPRLYNRYGIIAVNPEKYPDVNYLGAMNLIAWMTSIPGQSLVRNFQIDGETLFYPLAIQKVEVHGRSH